MITVTANARNATYISDDLITSGSVGIPVTFNLSEDFDGLSCIAVFEGSGASIDVALMDDSCVVPHEVLATAGGYLRIGIYARNSEGTIVIPTVWASAKMILQGAVPSEVDPSEPTPDWTAQVQAAAAEALQNSEEAIEIAGGADTAAEEARQSASAAATSATAADQSASAAGTAQAAAEAAQAAAVSARDAAVTAKGNADSSAQAAAGSATTAANSAAAAAASEAAAKAVEESIPADYIDLSNDVSDLKSRFDDVSAFSKTLGYIPPTYINSDFVNGMYANSVWRDTGNYAKSRSVHALIPLDDYVITAVTEDYDDLVLTVLLYNAQNTQVSAYKVGGSGGTAIQYSTVIQAGSYEILKSEALQTNANAVTMSVSVGRLSGSTWLDLPSDLALELRLLNGEESVLTKINALRNATENSPEVVRLADLPTFAWGRYIVANGSLSSASAHKVVSTTIKNVKSITIAAAQNPGAICGVVKDSGGNVVSVLERAYHYERPYIYEVSLTKDVEYTLYLNYFSYATSPNPYYDSATLAYNNPVDFAQDEVEEIARDRAAELPHHCVYKPFNFSGKTAVFFGDSITKGVINADGTQVTAHNYPAEFSARVGLTPTNKAVNGSRFYNEAGSSVAAILTQLQGVTLSDYDFVFIAGGINDVNSTSVENMLEGLAEVIAYVKANFNGPVIWITPIASAKDFRTVYNEPKNVNEYVAAMTEQIKSSDSDYRFSVVQGWEFGFPTIDSDAAYKNAMFGDGMIHPSELGYNALYVPGLLSALC